MTSRQVYLGLFVCLLARLNTRGGERTPHRRSWMLTNFWWQRDCVSTTSGIMRAASRQRGGGGGRRPRGGTANAIQPEQFQAARAGELL